MSATPIDRPVSALYFGHVMHRRVRPFEHRFVYPVFSLFVDLDELPVLDRRLRLFSHNRSNLFTLRDCDHGPGEDRPLKPWVERHLAAQGLHAEEWRIFLLCFPRLLGYVFNPLSVYFCYDGTGALRAVLYQVSNTFAQRHSYLLPVMREPGTVGPIQQACAKRFYVSPFIPMEASYRFRLMPPGRRLSLHIEEDVTEGRLLNATWTGRRAPLTDSGLAKAFLRLPLMTFKITAAIHWQALHLWRKGAVYHARPAPPADEVEYGSLPHAQFEQ